MHDITIISRVVFPLQSPPLFYLSPVVGRVADAAVYTVCAIMYIGMAGDTLAWRAGIDTVRMAFLTFKTDMMSHQRESR